MNRYLFLFLVGLLTGYLWGMTSQFPTFHQEQAAWTQPAAE